MEDLGQATVVTCYNVDPRMNKLLFILIWGVFPGFSGAVSLLQGLSAIVVKGSTGPNQVGQEAEV